ncbi:MAG: hypothetical protein U0Q11_05080 [Vicinamibacterales bacterium]
MQKIVTVEGDIFGEYPTYEPGTYTFIADYLPQPPTATAWSTATAPSLRRPVR